MKGVIREACPRLWASMNAVGILGLALDCNGREQGQRGPVCPMNVPELRAELPALYTIYPTQR